MPDEWLLSTGQPHHYRVPASNKGRELDRRDPTPGEEKVISDILNHFGRRTNKAFLLGDGNKVVLTEFKYPVNENSILLSASIDKTVTAMSAGVAICDGKISIDTKAKDVLPELTGTFIGNTTLRDNLMMASGTTRAFDDSQSLTSEEIADMHSGKRSLMDFMKGRWSLQQDRNSPGKTFEYKSQDPFLVGMMVSAAYGNNGKNFRQWQTNNFFTKVQTNDRRIQGNDRFGYANSDGNTRMTINDWARFAVFVQESRKQPGCFGDFVRDATKTQIKSNRRFARMYDGYGYFIWTDNNDIPNSYSALGYGGQAIIWSTVNDKFFVVFSNNENPGDLHKMAKAWLQSK